MPMDLNEQEIKSLKKVLEGERMTATDQQILRELAKSGPFDEKTRTALGRRAEGKETSTDRDLLNDLLRTHPYLRRRSDD